MKDATVYAASRSGKLWKSVDRGATFAALAVPIGATDDIYTLRFEPGKPEHLWLAAEKGLFRSADGGASWQRADRDSGRYLLQRGRARSRRRAPNPARRERRRRDLPQRRWRRELGALELRPDRRLGGADLCRPGSATLFVQTATGLFRRDADGTWDEKAEPFEDDGDEVELDGMLFDGKSPETIWAFDSSSAWRSSDGGRSFRALEKKEPSMREMMKGNLASAQFRSLAQDPGESEASSMPDRGRTTIRGRRCGSRSTAARASRPPARGCPGDDVTLLRAAAPGVVYAVVGKALFRTDDGGAKWVAAGGGLPGSGGDLRDLGTGHRPDAGGRLFIATEKGLFLSSDSGASFRKADSALAEEDVESGRCRARRQALRWQLARHLLSRDAGATWTAMSDGLPTRTFAPSPWAAPPGTSASGSGTAVRSVFSTPLP